MNVSWPLPYLFGFPAIACVLAAACRRARSVGIVAAFCFQLGLLYWVGAVLHALPWAELGRSDLVFEGLRMATWALVSFAAGVVVLGPMLSRLILGLVGCGSCEAFDASVSRLYITIGAIAYFVLEQPMGTTPGLQAIPAAASQLAVAGCCLHCWVAWHTKGRVAMLRGLAASALIPLVILATQGFMSYGVIALSAILLFIAQFFRPRWITAAVLIVLVWPGLSVFETYMRDRFEIRSAVWGGDGLPGRLARVWRTAKNVEAFDPRSEEQLQRIDERLNQSVLVGEAIENLSSNGGFLGGGSIRMALLGFVPRFLWPGKPPAGGSGDIVSRLTGRPFAAGTSIGVGPVLEFYGDFGTPGVILGFVFLGGIVRALDGCAAEMLCSGEWGFFATFFLMGIGCVNVSGSLVEVTASTAASCIVGIFARILVRRAPPALQAEAAAG